MASSAAPGLTEEAHAAAMSAWDREGGGARRGRGTIFRSAALERIFLLAPPWLPYVAMGPIAIAAIVAGAHALSTGILVVAVALGVLGWTLIEYLMHRFLFHATSTGEKGRVVLFLVHGHHHVWPDDPSRVAATPLQFGSLALLIFGLLSLALPPALADATFGGTMLGYLAYEAVHFHAHHGRTQRGPLGALRRHHMRHHHESPRARWGIGSPLWDHVLRTHEER